jgi:hypothetical protein
MNKKYIVELTTQERQRLEELIDTGKAAKYKIRNTSPVCNGLYG